MNRATNSVSRYQAIPSILLVVAIVGCNYNMNDLRVPPGGNRDAIGYQEAGSMDVTISVAGDGAPPLDWGSAGDSRADANADVPLLQPDSTPGQMDSVESTSDVGAPFVEDATTAPGADVGTNLPLSPPDSASNRADAPMLADAGQAETSCLDTEGGGETSETGGTTASTGGAGGSLGSGGTGGTSTTAVIYCDLLSNPANGTVSVPSTTVGSTAIYSCATGYGPSGSSTRTCLADGNWTGTAPTCVVANCPALPGPTGGTVAAPTLTFGSTATYSCLVGYNMSGTATRMCQADGTWMGTAPTCVPVDCGTLSAPSNGAVNAPTTTYPSTATYSCLTGYALSAGAARSCQASGTWSGSPPVCTLVDCGTLTAPEHGTISAPSTKYLATATYSCLSGFSLSGNATRTCQASGTWGESAPLCLCANGTTTCNGSCVDTQIDDNNCGGCGKPCVASDPSVAQCAAGRCLVTLASAQAYPGSIAVDEQYVYWTTSTPGHGGGAHRVSLNGGLPFTYPSSGFGPNGGGISVDAQNVYWETDSPAVMMAPLNGLTPASPIATCCAQPLGGIAPSGGYVYWGNSDGTLMVVAADGSGSPLQLASGLSSNPICLTVNEGYVYWGSSDGTVMRMPSDGSNSPKAVAVDAHSPKCIAVDAGYVYWTIPVAGTVVKAPKNGSPTTAPIVLASGQASPSGIGLDATNLYWTNSQGGSVMMVPLAGGSPTALVSGQTSPTNMVVDRSSVYWIDSGQSGVVMKLYLR